MYLTKKGTKWTEKTLTRTAKFLEIGIRTYEVSLYEDVIGRVEKTYHGWAAYDAEGNRVGLSQSKAEARFFVAWHFVGDESIDFETN